MKKIDKLVLGAFLGPFLMTFLVVVFILLTQHMLKYFDDIIGKGLGIDVIGQLLFYFAIFMTPVALPLAVLLSSLMAFGNLGEHFELTALKSAGISLVRAMRPIFFFVILLTGLAFYANNNLVPKAALEAYSLLYDIKQKKPTLDLREGSFYNGINDISIKVNKKYPDGITLKDVIVYDHRSNDGNSQVTVADSGKMYTILNDRYLKFELFDGYNYSEGAGNQRALSGTRSTNNVESLTRSKFSKSQVVFDLSSFQLERTDKKWFQGNRIMRNLNQLKGDIDSIRRDLMNQQLSYYQYSPAYFSYYKWGDSIALPSQLDKYKRYRDSINSLPYQHKQQANGETKTTAAARAIAKKDTNKTAALRNNARIIKKRERMTETKPAPAAKVPSPEQKPSIAQRVAAIPDSVRQAKLDSIFLLKLDREHLQNASNNARQVKGQVTNVNTGLENFGKDLRVFQIQWHKIIASSFACIAMFLIGAPLGAIIKKGGLGMPFLVSVLFFIIYYVVTMQGEKLAKQGTIPVPAGVWLADTLLFAVGMVFLRQARIDARLFEGDFYRVLLDRLKNSWKKRKALQQVSQP